MQPSDTLVVFSDGISDAWPEPDGRRELARSFAALAQRRGQIQQAIFDAADRRPRSCRVTIVPWLWCAARLPSRCTAAGPRPAPVAGTGSDGRIRNRTAVADSFLWFRGCCSRAPPPHNVMVRSCE